MTDEQKIVISSNEEKNFDKQIRPNLFDDFIGQASIVKSLKTYITAAKQRGEALDHILLYGPPGLGKTTLSNIIATELEKGFLSTSGPVISIPGDLSGMLTNLQDRDVFFIDEIHRVNTTVEEYLYSAMEDFKIDILIDSGPNARTVRIDLEPFTLVGATTRLGNISRGTPRIANRVLKRVRDFAQEKNVKEIKVEDARSSLDSIGIDENGLENMDRKILKNLIVNYNGGPTGGKSLAISINEDIQTIEDVYEPYLIKEGFIERTSRGRIATDKAYALFDLKK